LKSLFLSLFVCCQSTLGCFVCLYVPIDDFIFIDVALEIVDNLTPL
jgi:hypothetical protein